MSVSTRPSSARAPNGLTPVGKSRICVADLRCSSVRYIEYLPSSRLGPLATARFPSVRQTVRCSRRPHQTSQPPWKSSTRAAGGPRPCWLSFSSYVYVKRVSSTFARRDAPAGAGAWEDEQLLELLHRCSTPPLASHVPNRGESVHRILSYCDLRDFRMIPKPQPRPIDTTPMTWTSGFEGMGRRNSQG
jgi:hypothetical protein